MNAPVKIDPLVELRAAGLTVALKDERLVVSPASGLTDAHRQILRCHRAVIVEALETEAAITEVDLIAVMDTLTELDAAIMRLAELEAWTPELLHDVQEARRRMRPCDVPGSLAEFRRLVVGAEPSADDRRTCDQCANLIARRCAAAKRGEIVANRGYEPARDLPRRCEGYRPGPDDPDRRPGRERWPWLIHLIRNGGEE